jgi:hypothetical protein
LQLWHQLKRYCVLKHQTEWMPKRYTNTNVELKAQGMVI